MGGDVLSEFFPVPLVGGDNRVVHVALQDSFAGWGSSVRVVRPMFLREFARGGECCKIDGFKDVLVDLFGFV